MISACRKAACTVCFDQHFLCTVPSRKRRVERSLRLSDSLLLSAVFQIAFIFLFFAWVATTTSLALTHERVPAVDPLPDVVLDNVNYQSWGLDASEIIIMAATLVTFILALFHQHRDGRTK